MTKQDIKTNYTNNLPILQNCNLLLNFFLVLMLANIARADVVWPALYLQARLLSVWPIIIGLIIEYLFLLYYFKLSIKRAILADLAMNAVSSGLGIIMIPIIGLGWEYFPGEIINDFFHFGTFNPITWTATCIIAVIINTLLEALVLLIVFKTKIKIKGFGMLFVANAISVAIAMASLHFFPKTL